MINLIIRGAVRGGKKKKTQTKSYKSYGTVVYDLTYN